MPVCVPKYMCICCVCVCMCVHEMRKENVEKTFLFARFEIILLCHTNYALQIVSSQSMQNLVIIF